MPYAVFPPLGFARLGNSEAFFIGPDRPGGLGVETGPSGVEQPVLSYKDDTYRMKRQAARFQLFESDGQGSWRPSRLPAGAVVRWTVSLANRKDAIHRPQAPPDHPTPVRDDPAKQDRLIEGRATVSGAAQPLQMLTGHYLNEPVALGEIATDPEQRLLVLAGRGRSGSPLGAPIGGSFYTNPGWFDDVGDGPVEATVELPDGRLVEAAPAWVMTTPPDFAPAARGVVTLHDVIKQVALDEGWIQRPGRPSFESDIRPMVERTSDLRLVDSNPAWALVSRDWAVLADPDPLQQPLRAATATLVREVENALHDFSLQEWQSEALDMWVEGDFEPAGGAAIGPAEVLTRATLDGTVGQGFFPGIEAGVNLRDPTLYGTSPFEYRLKPGVIRPGDATAHMAQPWQADFLKCADGWWPTQRPDILPAPSGGSVTWLRPGMSHARLVEDVMRLGVATPDGAGGVVEGGRDPSL